MLKHEKRWGLWAWMGMLLLPVFMVSGCGGGGTTTITATSPTFGGTPVPVLTSIFVTASNLSIAYPMAQQFTATGIYSDGSTNDMTKWLRWSSTDPAVASISGLPGVAISAAVGTTSIMTLPYLTSSGPISGSAMLTVTGALPSTIIGTYAVGGISLGMAIDAAGHVWVNNIYGSNYI